MSQDQRKLHSPLKSTETDYFRFEGTPGGCLVQPPACSRAKIS